MRKTGKWIAGVLLAMGMILAGTVSRVCGNGSECRKRKMGRRFRQRHLDGQYVGPVLSGKAVPE